MWERVKQNIDTMSTIELLNWFENIVANGEIVHNEQFLHLPQCFQKLSVYEVKG